MVVRSTFSSVVDDTVLFMKVIEGIEGLVNIGLVLVDCGSIVIFSLGGAGSGFFVLEGLLGGGL